MARTKRYVVTRPQGTVVRELGAFDSLAEARRAAEWYMGQYQLPSLSIFDQWAGLTVPPSIKRNPRRRKSRYSKRARTYIGRTIRRLAHRGERAPQRIAIALSKARRRGFKVPKRARPNPAETGFGDVSGTTFSESKAWKAVRSEAHAILSHRLPRTVEEDAERIRQIANAMLAQVERGVHANPALAVIGANPPRGKMLGYVVGDLKYHRTIGAQPGWYHHTFKRSSRARLLAMPDGSLRITGH